MNILADDLINYHCPRWDELPEIELYIDQVVSILQNNLSLFLKDEDSPIITSSMINNYVKKEVIKSPIKKKYNKDHLARLFVICICKRLMSISEVKDCISSFERFYSVSEGYNLFCDEIEVALKNTFTPKSATPSILLETDVREIATLKAIASAFANSLLVDRLIEMRNR